MKLLKIFSISFILAISFFSIVYYSNNLKKVEASACTDPSVCPIYGVVGAGAGSITSVSYAESTLGPVHILVTPNSGYVVDTLTGNVGSCRNVYLNGNYATIDSVLSSCTVTVTFKQVTAGPPSVESLTISPNPVVYGTSPTISYVANSSTAFCDIYIDWVSVGPVIYANVSSLIIPNLKMGISGHSVDMMCYNTNWVQSGWIITYFNVTAPNCYTPSGYIYCSDEGGTCGFSGTARVGYGCGDFMNYKRNVTSIACTNDNFGDPAPNVPKSCYYLPGPINGGWSDWSAQDNTQGFYAVDRTQTRTCTNPSPQYGGADCSGPSTQTYHVPAATAAVTSVSFSPNPVPYGGTATVSFSSNGYGYYCHILLDWTWGSNGGWDYSGYFGSATTTIPAMYSPGGHTISVICYNSDWKIVGDWTNTYFTVNNAPVNGGWSGWSAQDNTCGFYAVDRNQTRSCTNPSPAYGGADCSGSSTQSYHVPACTSSINSVSISAQPVIYGSSPTISFSGNSNTYYCDVYVDWGSLFHAGIYATSGSYSLSSFGWGLSSHNIDVMCYNSDWVQSGWAVTSFNVSSPNCYTPSGYTYCSAENGTCGFSGGANVAFGCGDYMSYKHTTNGIICDTSAFSDPAPNVPKCCYYLHDPINGGWSDWSAQDNTRGYYAVDRTQTRYCNNPTPQYGGADCSGSSTQIYHVPAAVPSVDSVSISPTTIPYGGSGNISVSGTNAYYCYSMIDSNYSPYLWNGYYSNGLTINTGTMTSPGSHIAQVLCYNSDWSSHNGYWYTVGFNVSPAPINGGWSDWSAQDNTCGYYAVDRTQTRTCTNPSPAYGGADCSGSSTQSYHVPACSSNITSIYVSPNVIPYGGTANIYYSCTNGYYSHLIIDDVWSPVNDSGYYSSRSPSTTGSLAISPGSHYAMAYCYNSDMVPSANSWNRGGTFYVLPPAPTGLTVSPSSCNNNWLDVSWSAVSGATNYKVYRNGSLVYDGGGTSFRDGGLSLGGGYSYVVNASNAWGTSPNSGTVSGTVAPNCPIAGGWSGWSAQDNTQGFYAVDRTQTRYCNNPSPQYGGADCSGLDGGNSTKTYHVPAATAAVNSVSISPNPVSYGGTTTISYSANGYASYCYILLDWNWSYYNVTSANSGSYTTPAMTSPGGHTASSICINSDGADIGYWTSNYFTVNNAPTPTPNLTFTVWGYDHSDGPGETAAGYPITLYWNAVPNATSCTLDGSAVSVSGGSSGATANVRSQTHTLTCTNATGQSASDSVIITTPPDPTNVTYSCSADALTATVSWNTSLGYNTFYTRASIGSTNLGAPAWDDSHVGTSVSFGISPNTDYNFWVHTRTPANGAWSNDIHTYPRCNRTHYLTVNTTGNGSGTVGGSGTYNYGTVVTATATPSASSHFSSWSGSCNSSGQVTMDADKTCTVNFTLNSYTVSTSAGTGGSISPTSASVNYGSGTSFTITPSSGYSINTVSGCSGSLSGSTYTTGAITSACTVTASFNQMIGSLTPAGPSCSIATGASSCNVTLTWATTNPISTSAVTASGMTTVNGNSGSQAFAVPYSSRVFYLYNNGLQLATTTGTASCVGGSTWDGSKCINPAGTLSATNCTIPLNASSCNTNLIWSTTNPIGTSSVTTPTSITVATANSSAGTSYAISSGVTNFYLYNNAIQIANVTATGTCATASHWGTTICVADNNPPNAPTITGNTSFYTNSNQTFNVTGTDPDNDTVIVGIDWNNDGTVDTWTSPLVNSGTAMFPTYSWSTPGTYTIKALTQDIKGANSPWSSAFVVTVTNPPVPASVGTFTVDNSKINFGQSVKLTWTSASATSCSMTSVPSPSVSIASLAPNTANNNITLKPTKTTIYSLICTGPGGDSPVSQVTVTVGKIQPVYKEL